MKNKDLKKRIIEISYKYQLSHIGSCITAVDIIDEIYSIKKPDEKFVLSAGHAHLAHAVVMEKYGVIESAEENIKKHGIHCERVGGCDVSTGSLGQGLSIAVGMALADRRKNVYCLISDGECAEGSITEAMRVREQYKINNLKVYLNLNGWAAYQRTDDYWFPVQFSPEGKIKSRDFIVYETNTKEWPEWLQGQQAHYIVMTEKQYNEVIKLLK